MKLSPKQYAATLYEILVGTPAKQQKDVIRNFLKYLLANNRLRLADKIATEFASHIEHLNKEEKIEVTSARPLSEKLRKEIRGLMKETLEVKNVVLNEKIDAGLLGGVRIVWGDEVVDASLKERLNQLKKHLQS